MHILMEKFNAKNERLHIGYLSKYSVNIQIKITKTIMSEMSILALCLAFCRPIYI